MQSTILVHLPEEGNPQKQPDVGKVLFALLRYLSYAALTVTLYLALVTIGFSLVSLLPPYGPSVLAFVVIAVAVGYLYLENRQEKKRVMTSLPEEEKSIFHEIETQARLIIEEGSY